jgi:ParB family transcriptional regulator, chromosome partitioning protein
LTLPDDVQDMVRDGKLSAGHARALIGSPKASDWRRRSWQGAVGARNRAADEGAGLGQAPPQRMAKGPEKDADTRALEGDLSANLKMPVRIEPFCGRGKRRSVIRYKSLDDLDRLCRILSQLPDED